MGLIRPAAVAGAFYPEHPGELSRQLQAFASKSAAMFEQVKALIVPHAGYMYSGSVAGKGYAVLNQDNTDFNRVVLLGPSHRVPLRGLALPQAEFFVTPLGKVKLDQVAAQKLIAKGLAKENALAHQYEHSLEVQLPFLQYCLNDFLLIPLVVGECHPSAVSHALDTLLNDVLRNEKVMLVVSTDLSHYLPATEANQKDGDTINHILALDNDIEPQQACGCFALNGLLTYARSQGWQASCVARLNSGDVSGDKNRVVGYASFVLH